MFYVLLRGNNAYLQVIIWNSQEMCSQRIPKSWIGWSQVACGADPVEFLSSTGGRPPGSYCETEFQALCIFGSLL